MLKRILALLCVLAALFQCSCLAFLFDSTEEKKIIREDFSEFHTENDMVYIYALTSIHFDTYSFNLDRILEENGLRSRKLFKYGVTTNGGFWFENDKLYFSAFRPDGDKYNTPYSFLIYECDLYGNNLKLVYEKPNYESYPSAIAQDGVFYIDYPIGMTPSTYLPIQQIDTYNLSTGEYTPAVAVREGSSWKDYQKNAAWEELGYQGEWPDYFEIILPEETESIILDDDFINSTIYADAMNKYGYSPHKWGIVNGRVILVYRLWEELNDLYYPHVVYEYDVGNHALIYKMIGFWGDDISDNDFRFIK